MLKLPYMDHSMERTVAMCEWQQDFDIWNHRCMSQMQFELMPLLPAAILGASNLCCSVPSSPLRVLPAAQCTWFVRSRHLAQLLEPQLPWLPRTHHGRTTTTQATPARGSRGHGR